MYVFLRLELDCSPDDAWNALGNPAVFRAVMRPLMRVRSLDAGGFPKRWSQDEVHHVSMRLFGVVPMGHHSIDITYTERPGGVRMVVDQGEPLSGILSRTSTWDHRMAVSASPGGKTLYRDRLSVKAGILTLPLWLGLWALWQYRGARLQKLARRWGS
ncbi:MAG: hypothetical protein RLZZ600_1342 [Actinomycetota bacterium]|jgi:hypothetical protein